MFNCDVSHTAYYFKLALTLSSPHSFAQTTTPNCCETFLLSTMALPKYETSPVFYSGYCVINSNQRAKSFTNSFSIKSPLLFRGGSSSPSLLIVPSMVGTEILTVAHLVQFVPHVQLVVVGLPLFSTSVLSNEGPRAQKYQKENYNRESSIIIQMYCICNVVDII